jgi:hypothetical protein
MRIRAVAGIGVIAAMLALTAGNATAQDVYVVEPLKLNSGIADFSPSITGDALYFCSRRKAKGSKKETLTDGYRCTLDDKGNPGAPELVTGPFFSEYHDGPFSLSPDGMLMAYSRNYEPETEGTVRKELPVGIFFSTRQADGTWSDPAPFPRNSADYSVAHPSFSVSGTELFFSSNMPGGSGGSDIYVSRYVAGSWSAPENLGPGINTSRQEVFPYMQQNGRLYFSSNGHSGFGGLDIFYTFRSDSVWWPVRPLDSPLNSTGDDFGFACLPGNTRGFFTSSRDGADKLYVFRVALPEAGRCDTLDTRAAMCATFFDEGIAALDTVPFIGYYWDMGDGTRLKGNTVNHCYRQPGTYTIRLIVSDTLIGLMDQEEAVMPFTAGKVEGTGIVMARNASGGMDMHVQEPAAAAGESNGVREYIWKFDDGSIIVGEYASPPAESVKKGAIVQLYIKTDTMDAGSESVNYIIQKIE